MEPKHLYFPSADIHLDISLPASKSISNRALIINALSGSRSEIRNLSDCDDTQVLIRALKMDQSIINVGAAGTAMRFLTAYLAMTEGEWTLTGSERMKQRPVKLLVEALNNLGAEIQYLDKHGFPPLFINGKKLKGGTIHLDGSVSSQYISALMMTAPCMQEGLNIVLEGEIISLPYILMTMNMMKEFGVEVKFLTNRIEITPQFYKPVDFSVESDWSAASYWFEILSLVGEGEIFLKGLHQNSYQGDSKVSELFDNLGVSVQYFSDGVLLMPNKVNIDYFNYDFINQPDLAQTFVVCCCLKNIPFHFKGLKSLKIKETDRIEALKTELAKFGFLLTEPAAGELAWSGEKKEACHFEETGEIFIETYDDHRMAMAFAPAALMFPVAIEHPEVVSKSYPTFWDDIEKIDKRECKSVN
ncbi:MAG: 3-phosphoshikimate 1-carboxyvinyltransferase [Paludibacteraceae bacterium]|nr:3-phosphoshikimate 1-carboxyvinyltransferase [Paludibacteraceae bacterium]